MNSTLAGRFVVVASLLGGCAFAGCVNTDESYDEDVGQDDTAVGAAVTIANPGFESNKASWGDEDLFAISTSDKHGGSKSAKVTKSGGKVQQTVTVTPNTTYTLSAWVLGKGTIGAKNGGSTLGSKSASASSWTKVSVTFSSGSATSVQIYGAYNGGEGRFDDFTMVAKDDGGSTSTSSTGTGAGGTGGTGAGGSGGTAGSGGTGGTGAGGAGGGTAVLPSDVLDLASWHLTLPVDTSHAGDPDQIEQPELDTFVHDTFFHLNAAKDAVVFRAYTNGDTTQNSGYPRSELRERASGYKLAAWSSSSGKHTMFVDQAVTHLPSVKPHIVVGQIHDGGDDVIVIRLEDKKLFIDLNGDDGPTLTSSYTLGTRFTIKFEVENDEVDVYYNGALKYTYPKSFSGAYFKAGAYVQSSCQGTKKVSGESCSAYGEAVIYDVYVQHQ